MTKTGQFSIDQGRVVTKMMQWKSTKEVLLKDPQDKQVVHEAVFALG